MIVGYTLQSCDENTLKKTKSEAMKIQRYFPWDAEAGLIKSDRGSVCLTVDVEEKLEQRLEEAEKLLRYAEIEILVGRSAFQLIEELKRYRKKWDVK